MEEGSETEAEEPEGDHIDKMLEEAEIQPDISEMTLERETPEEKRQRILNNTRPERLTAEQKQLFSYFAKVPGMDDQILDAIHGAYEYASEKTSHRGNIAIMGSHGTGKTRLSEGLVKAICKELDLFYRMPEKQEKCPRPLQYRDADLFLDAFEEWIHVYRESLKSQTAGKEKMEEAISYIRENYAKDLNMAMVSNHICMNYSLFSAAFKEHTGVNFVNYLKEIRIAEAKRLLIQTEDKITEIAKQVGFENDKHFMKSFKTACGVSPSEFRKDYKMVSNGKGGQDE